MLVVDEDERPFVGPNPKAASCRSVKSRCVHVLPEWGGQNVLNIVALYSQHSADSIVTLDLVVLLDLTRSELEYRNSNCVESIVSLSFRKVYKFSTAGLCIETCALFRLD